MGLVGILMFALNFLHLLAWPLLAFGYPLFASIRAIERDSNWETKKLVTYWISFSLLSLFEHSLLNLLQWIQFWPHIKLMIICLLVIPYFNGAFYVYNHLVRPYLLLDPQVIVDEFRKWMVLLCKRDQFLAEAERYIKGNGPKALEKLIDKEFDTQKPNVDVEEIKAIAAATEKTEVEWSDEYNDPSQRVWKDLFPAIIDGSYNKEPDILEIDNEAVEVTEKKEVPKSVLSSTAKESNQPTKQMVLAEPSLDQTDNKTSTTMEIKGPDMAVAAARELPDIHVFKEVQKEWTCAICQVTTRSENTLNMHLQGKKHKAAYKALKAKNQPNFGLKQKIILTDKEKTQGQQKNAKKEAFRVKNSTFKCYICNIHCSGKGNLTSHYKGKKHLAQVQVTNGCTSW